MREYRFNNFIYYTVKDVYMNLCATRNSVIRKIDKLEKLGYILRVKNKRPEIYINKNGYEILKQDRIKYLDLEIAKADNVKLKKYYNELKGAIGKPELWSKYHHKEICDKLEWGIIKMDNNRNQE